MRILSVCLLTVVLAAAPARSAEFNMSVNVDGIRLGAPNYPDCTMTLTGSVKEKGPLADDGRSGTVTVASAILGASALVWNEIEFHLYRRFTADSNITFSAVEDTPANAIPTSQLSEQPPK